VARPRQSSRRRTERPRPTCASKRPAGWLRDVESRVEHLAGQETPARPGGTSGRPGTQRPLSALLRPGKRRSRAGPVPVARIPQVVGGIVPPRTGPVRLTASFRKSRPPRCVLAVACATLSAAAASVWLRPARQAREMPPGLGRRQAGAARPWSRTLLVGGADLSFLPAPSNPCNSGTASGSAAAASASLRRRSRASSFFFGLLRTEEAGLSERAQCRCQCAHGEATGRSSRARSEIGRFQLFNGG